MPSIKNKSQKSYHLPSLTSSKSSVCKSASLVVLLTQLSLVSFSNAQQKPEPKSDLKPELKEAIEATVKQAANEAKSTVQDPKRASAIKKIKAMGLARLSVLSTGR